MKQIDLRESDDPHFRDLREALKNNPIFIVENASVALDYLRQGGYIYPTTQDSSFLPMIQEYCDLYYFSDGKAMGTRTERTLPLNEMKKMTPKLSNLNIALGY
uniref:Uncharacterized protein n=1 Tax=Acrobeloides nanus TaxID=290746 RepID=A0A914CKQ0_9BILA